MKIFLSILVLFFTMLLQGCIATAVVSTVAIGAKAVTDPRTIGTQVDDSTLELRINKALSKNEQIKKRTRINATVYQGKVLLVGQAPNNELVSLAEQIAMGIEGTTQIYNEIRQSKPINFGITSLDTWITMKVRSRLLGNNQIKSSNIEVITENGEVFLLGLVTEHEGKVVANIASRTSGVRHVITAFTYTK